MYTGWQKPTSIGTNSRHGISWKNVFWDGGKDFALLGHITRRIRTQLLINSGVQSLWRSINVRIGSLRDGADRSELGRWSWLRLRGRNEVFVRIVSAYRPNPPIANSPMSVYAQQKCTLNLRNDRRCPREAFWDDILKEIATWQEEGDQVVLMLDANQDVRDQVIKNKLATVQMREILLERHGQDAPNTYNRGRLPIDGIFATPAIDIIKGGYHGFGDTIPSDHRCLWFDVSYTTAFGHDLPKTVHAKARRLKMEDPRTVSSL